MNSAPKKILIVKTGYTELLTDELSGGPSLGDVFRTTCLLHEFPNAEITWLTHELALTLLPDRRYVRHAVADTPENREKLCSTCFDVVINLEREPQICHWLADLMKRSKSKSLLGFQPDELLADSAAQKRTINIDSLLFRRKSGDGPEIWEGSIPGVLDKAYQYYLFSAVGFEWREQPYTVPAGVEINVAPQFDVGFNHAVGVKWPVKAWKNESWQALAKLCEKNGISHSFQEGFDDLKKYFDWILKHRVIISSDSLGLHLSIALGRRVIGLFGPTHATNIHFYNQGEAISATSDCPIMPCFLHECRFTQHCMENISEQMVFEKLKIQLGHL